MRRPPAAVRHISAHPLAFAVVAGTVLFTTMCAAAAASFASGVTTIAVRRSLTADPGTAIGVSVSGPAAQSTDLTARIGHQLTTAASGLPLRISDGRQSSFFSLPGRGRAETQFVTLSALPRHATLLTGHWPAGMAGNGAGGAAGSAGTAGSASGAAPLPACLPAPTARRLHLAAGDLLTLRGVADRITITARVSCTFARREPGSGYWSLSPVSAAGFQKDGGPVLFGPLVISPAVLAARQVPVQSAGLWAQPDFGGLHAPSLAGLADRLSGAVNRLTGSNALGGATVSTRLPGLLSELATAVVVSRSQLLIGLLILLVIAGATIAVTVRLLVVAREAEMALLAARGAARRQLAVRGLADALLLAIPAAVAGRSWAAGCSHCSPGPACWPAAAWSCTRASLPRPG